MAERGGYEQIPEREPEGESNPGYDNNDDEDENKRRWEEQGAIPKKSGEEEMRTKYRGKFYSRPEDVPGYIKTSTTSKEGEQETSFDGEDLFRERLKKREELEKKILNVFPNIKKKLLPRIFSDEYGRLIYKGDRTFKDGFDKNLPHIIAEGGRPSHDYSLKKFPQGLKRDLGRTNIEINQEAYRKQQEEEARQAKREQEMQQIRKNLAGNDEKLLDTINRKDNLIQVLKEQKDAMLLQRKTKNPTRGALK